MRRVLLALGLAALLLLTGCTDDADPTTTSTASTVAETSTTTPGAGSTTTVPVDGPTTSTTLPTSSDGVAYIGVRIDNGPGVAQFNLGQADIIIESMVEGGLTRFTALYRDDRPTFTGPVRSLRPVDIDLLAPFRPLVVTSGAQPWVRQAIDAIGVPVLGPESGVLTDTGNVPPNHLATSPEGLTPSTGFAEVPTPFGSSDAVSGDDPVDRLEVAVSPTRTVGFVVDGDQLVREQDGAVQPWFDADGEAFDLLVDTVVVLFANERPAGYADTAGSPVFDYDVIGSGQFAMATIDGFWTGTWSRATLDDGWVLTTEAGDEVSPPEGRLFVLVVSDEAELSTS